MSENSTDNSTVIMALRNREIPLNKGYWTEKEKESVILYIKDYGQGIHPQDIGRIFEKGYTGKNFHNGKYKSTGMGLYMAKTIMERMGHRIKAESIYGEYSRFSVIFRENSYFLNG